MANPFGSSEVDVSDLAGALERLHALTRQLSGGTEKLDGVSVKYGKNMEWQTVTVNKLSEANERLSQTFKRLEKDGFETINKLVGESFSRPVPKAGFSFSSELEKIGQAYGHLVDVTGEGTAKISRMMELATEDSARNSVEQISLLHVQQEETKKALAAEANAYYESKGQINRILELGAEQSAENGIKELQQLHKDQLEKKRILEQEVKDLQLADHLRQQEWLRMNAARVSQTNAEAEAEAERIRKLHASQAEQLQNVTGAAGIAGQLKAAGPGALPVGTTAGEYRAYQSAISRITQLVEEGSISQQRAWAVVQASVAKTGQVFTGVEAQVESATLSWQEATKRLGDSHQRDMARVENESRNVGQRIVITWQDVVRFIQFRVAYAIGFHLVGAFKAASTEIRQFEIHLSEIRTLSQDAGVSFKQWADIVYQLSNRFGQPAEDVAKGLYETISNQIARGTDAATFMASAMKFAAVTVTSTANAVDLLSSALNAYGISVTEAERVSSVFFRLIDRGRVRAEDMANSFGPLAVTSNQLGVSLEETAAALATITIQGVKPSVAMTMLNNLFAKMIKPSTELTKVFHEMGVENGFAAVQAFGFMGTLEKLRQVGGDTVTELSKEFKEQRAFRAIETLDQAFAGFKDTLAEMQGDTLPKYNKAFDIAMESSGRTVEIEFTKIRNFMLKEWATSFNDILAGKEMGGVEGLFSAFIKGAGGLSGAVQTLTTSVKYLVEAFVAWKAIGFLRDTTLWPNLAAGVSKMAGAYRSLTDSIASRDGQQLMLFPRQLTLMEHGFATASVAAKGFGLALKTILTPEILLTGGILLWQYFSDKEAELQRKLAAAREEGEEHWRKILEESTKAAQDEYSKRIQHLRQAVDKEFELRNQATADVLALAYRASEAQNAVIKRSTEVLRDAYQLVVRELEAGIRKLESSANRSVENARKAQETVSRLNEGAEERLLRTQLQGLSPEDEITKRQQLAAEMHAKGLELLQRAQGSNDPEETNRLIEDGNRKIAKSLELLDAVGSKREHIEERLKALRQELADIDTKGAGRDAILAQEEKLHKLQSERADLSRRRKTDEMKAADEEIAKQQKLIQQSREGNRDAGDAERERRIKEQIGSLEKQLGLIGDRKTAEDKVLASIQAQSDLLDQIAQNEEDRALIKQKDAEDEKKRVEELKTALTDMANFKLPKEFMKFQGEGNLSGPSGQAIQSILQGIKQADAMKGFNDAFGRANAAGITDPALAKSLIDQRAALEKKLNIDLGAQRLQLDIDRRAKEKDELEKRQKETQDQQAKHGGDWLNPNQISLGGQLNSLIAKMTTFRGSGAALPIEEKFTQDLQYWQARLTEVTKGQATLAQKERELQQARVDPLQKEKIPALTTEIESLRKTLSSGESYETISAGIRKAALEFQGAAVINPEGDVGGRNVSKGDIERIQAELAALPALATTLANLVDAAKGREKFVANQKYLEERITGLSEAIRKSLEEQAKKGGDTATSVDNFRNSVDSTIGSLRDLENSIKATSEQLKKVIGTPPTPGQPRTSLPTSFFSPGVPDNSNVASTTVTFGDIILNNQSTGNAVADARQLSNQFLSNLNNAFRQGRATLPNEATA